MTILFVPARFQKDANLDAVVRALRKRPSKADTIAARSQVHPRTVRRILDLLVAQGIAGIAKPEARTAPGRPPALYYLNQQAPSRAATIPDPTASGPRLSRCPECRQKVLVAQLSSADIAEELEKSVKSNKTTPELVQWEAHVLALRIRGYCTFCATQIAKTTR